MRVCLNPNVARSSLAVRPSFLRKWKMREETAPFAIRRAYSTCIRRQDRKEETRPHAIVCRPGLEVFLFEGERTPLSRGLSKLLQHRSSLGVIYAPIKSALRPPSSHTFIQRGASPYIEDSAKAGIHADL